MAQLEFFDRHPILRSLDPLMDDLHEAVHRGWTRAQRLWEAGEGPEPVPLDGMILSSRAQASVNHSFIVDELRNLAARVGDPMVLEAIEGSHTTLFRASGRVILRVKKMTAGGRTTNYPTERAIAYDCQQLLLDLGAAANLVRVDLGYVVRSEGSAIDVLLVCRNADGDVAWIHDVVESLAPVVASSAPPVAPRRRLVLPKKVRAAGDESES